MTTNGEIERSRSAQARAWLWSEIAADLLETLRADPKLRSRAEELEKAVAAGKTSPRVAARQLVDTFWQQSR